ncbi:MAG: hypothetical protein Rhob2KO_20410 [Rhodopirellula baltica]
MTVEDVTFDEVKGGGLGVVQTISCASAMLMVSHTNKQQTNHSKTVHRLPMERSISIADAVA